jgi:hypothetical protein
MVIITVILLLILIPASTWWFGLWSNFLTLINFFISALIASSFYENAGIDLANQMSGYEGLTEFLSIWLIFLGSFVVCRAFTDSLSKYKLEFDYVTELVGRSIFSIWLALAFVSFTLFTFHLAPLHPDAFQADVETKTLGVGPDRMWMAFIQSRSRGALSTKKQGNLSPPYRLPVHPDDVDLDARVFDPFGGFIEKYQKHRVRLSKQNGFGS